MGPLWPHRRQEEERGWPKHLTDVHASLPVLRITGCDSPQHWDRAHRQLALSCGALKSRQKCGSALHHQDCTAEPWGRGSRSRQGQGLASSVFVGTAQPPQRGPDPPRAHLAGMRHSRKSRVVTLLQVSTPWPCSHFSTAMSVAGDGWTRSRTCSRDRYLPVRHGEGQSTLLAGPDGAWRAQAHSRYHIVASGGLRQHRRAGRDAPHLAAGGRRSAALRGRASRVRHGSSLGARCGQAVSGRWAPAPRVLSHRPRHLPERLVTLQGRPRGAAPGGRTQRQHGGDPPTPATGGRSGQSGHRRGPGPPAAPGQTRGPPAACLTPPPPRAPVTPGPGSPA